MEEKIVKNDEKLEIWSVILTKAERNISIYVYKETDAMAGFVNLRKNWFICRRHPLLIC